MDPRCPGHRNHSCLVMSAFPRPRMIANIFAVREYIRYLRRCQVENARRRTTRAPTRLNTVIETERLVLQVPRADDRDDFVELMTDDEAARCTTHGPAATERSRSANRMCSRQCSDSVYLPATPGRRGSQSSLRRSETDRIE